MGGGCLIFVLVGTHTQPFDRLLKKIDNLIEDGKIVESVVAQIGISEYIPKNYKFKSFFPEKERSAFHLAKEITLEVCKSLENNFLEGNSLILSEQIKNNIKDIHAELSECQQIMRDSREDRFTIVNDR